MATLNTPNTQSNLTEEKRSNWLTVGIIAVLIIAGLFYAAFAQKRNHDVTPATSGAVSSTAPADNTNSNAMSAAPATAAQGTPMDTNRGVISRSNDTTATSTAPVTSSSTNGQ